MQGFRLILAYFPASLTLFLWLYSFLYKGFSLFGQALDSDANLTLCVTQN
jgi:hypothetical protein